MSFGGTVRPNLEYAATVWDPYTKFNINKLEKCQRRAARFVIGDYSRESSVFFVIYIYSKLGRTSVFSMLYVY
jgi:hypothetical protein